MFRGLQEIQTAANQITGANLAGDQRLVFNSTFPSARSVAQFRRSATWARWFDGETF